MAEEMRSNHINDEFASIEELEKQKIGDELGQITNIYKEDDDDNFVSKRLKSDSDEDIKSGTESNADSYGVTGVKRIENPNRKKIKLQKLSSLNAFFADTSEPVLKTYFLHERQQKEKEQPQNYQNLHAQGDTKQAQSDLATNVADKTRDEKEKSEQEMVNTLSELKNDQGK